MQKKLFETSLMILLFLICSVITYATQKPITLNNGKGWDGVFYYTLAEQMTNGDALGTKAPWTYRIGTPFLASLVPGNDILLNFRIVNFIACAISVVLFSIWFRFYISDLRIRIVLMLLFVSQWIGPVRYIFFYPAYTDPWAYVFFLAGLIIMHNMKQGNMAIKTLGLSVVSFVGLMFRDVIVAIPVTWWCVQHPALFSNIMHGIRYITGNAKRWTFNTSVLNAARISVQGTLPLVAIIASFIIIRSIVHQTNEFLFYKEALTWLYTITPLSYLHAWFICFGPLLVLPLANPRLLREFMSRHQTHLIFLCIIACFAWIGGGPDMVRYLMWGTPIVYVIIGIALEDKLEILKRSPLLVIFIVLMQCISQRVFWTTPDYSIQPHSNIIFLTVMGSSVNYLDLFSYPNLNSPRLITRFISLAQYITIGLILLIWLRNRELKLIKSAPKAS